MYYTQHIVAKNIPVETIEMQFLAAIMKPRSRVLDVASNVKFFTIIHEMKTCFWHEDKVQ